MANVTINDECVGCRTCAGICPEVFEMKDGVAVVIMDPIEDDFLEDVQDAVDSCGFGAIELTD
ncbi:MAG: ferredoxin [Bifidobacteriaceae bacterium]|jgi:ferredoxin|nr:ferredoxin [Bifidobacteriaceae bacterium]